MTNIFSEHIKELRIDKNMNQADFAELISTNQSTLSAYERGDRLPPYETLICIAQLCNVSLDWLCGLSDIKTPGDKLNNYSDVIRIFLKLEDARIDGLDCKTYVDSYGRNMSEISFQDKTISNFLTEWKKLRELYYKSMIDGEVYALWIEKSLKKYNHAIEHDGSMHVPEGFEEELPFT